MRRITAADRWLLGVLLPAWLVCLGLHVKEIARTGFAESPIYAAPARTPDAHPTVGGFRVERGRGGAGIELGDTLLEVGELDLRGVGYIGFDAAVFDQAGTRGSVPLRIERAGVEQTVRLELLPSGRRDLCQADMTHLYIPRHSSWRAPSGLRQPAQKMECSRLRSTCASQELPTKPRRLFPGATGQPRERKHSTASGTLSHLGAVILCPIDPPRYSIAKGCTVNAALIAE